MKAIKFSTEHIPRQQEKRMVIKTVVVRILTFNHDKIQFADCDEHQFPLGICYLTEVRWKSFECIQSVASSTFKYRI